MLSITLDSACDVCIEEFGKDQRRRPRVLPCGHVLCATCTSGIIRTAPRGEALCPFCRHGFTNDSTPFLRVDAHAQASSSSSSLASSSGSACACWSAKSTTEDAGEEVIHTAYCNLCMMNLKGVRHKCLTCPDYDVCDMCITAVHIHHPYHAFVKVTTAQDLMGTDPEPRPEHRAWCDNCQNRIRGIRYKCAHALCPDYDLCEDCEALPIPVHPHDHPLIKIRNTHVVVPHTHQTLIEDDFAPNNHMHLTRELISLLAASRRT